MNVDQTMYTMSRDTFDRILCNFNIRMMPGYRVGRRGRREEDIMQEIRTHGPLQATMDVHQAGNLKLTAL